jgi:hypothetical protein
MVIRSWQLVLATPGICFIREIGYKPQIRGVGQDCASTQLNRKCHLCVNAVAYLPYSGKLLHLFGHLVFAKVPWAAMMNERS